MIAISRRGVVRALASGLAALGVTAVAGAVPGLGGPARADTYPSKPVELIVPYRAGGGTDTMVRIFAKALSRELGQPVAVVNRKGGGGAVGASSLKNSPPDGYTILMGGDDITTYIPLASDVDFTFGDFRYLAAVAEYQNALIANKGVPYKTFGELVDYAKAHPGIRIAHQGGISQAFIERFVKQSGIDAKVVATGGGSECIQLLLGGQIDVSYSGGIHNANPEQWEVLGSFNAHRLPSSPDKPTFKEAGFGVSMPAYVIFMTGAGVPDDIAVKLETAILAATNDTDFRKIVEERLKAPVLSVNSADLGKYMTGLDASMKDMLGK